MSDGETTLLRINEQGVTTIPSEVREVLGIDGKRAILRVKDIEVAKITEDPTTESETVAEDDSNNDSNGLSDRGHMGIKSAIVGLGLIIVYFITAIPL
jgi:bifunctional DNA-binding transcriptional regulator/antitoxin component of YhaV-PrlF toxin-antitoxin module